MSDIINLKGIGEKTALLYNKIGIDKIEDLYEYFPRDYVFYSDYCLLSELCLDKQIVFRAYVSKHPAVKRIRNLSITTVLLNYISDKPDVSSITVNAKWFHMPYLSNSLIVGKEYVFRGIITSTNGNYYIDQPQIFSVEEYEKLKNTIGPVYSLTKGLTNKALTKSVKNAFDLINDNSSDLYSLHFPKDYEKLREARSNLVYEEFLLFILYLRLLKNENERAKNDFKIIEVSQTGRIIESLPYKLTVAQLKVWREIADDMCKDRSMSRLVQGDVGSGKTIIAFLAAVTAALNGYQCAVMAPTEILATQHYESFCQLIKSNNLDIECILLTGSVTAANKRKIKEKIAENKISIVIGTHAIIQNDVSFNKLALVITDEQHRFGVNQREMLKNKGSSSNAHVLVMSATPIPRTLAIILYGDLDISVIDELPAKRLPIKNCVIAPRLRKKSYDFIYDEIKRGHQAYVICSLVEESEGVMAEDVVGYTEKLKAYFPEDINIACLNGKMKPSMKQSIMNSYFKGDVDILVSTTVVEVGVNVPNATVMMIEDANRFGLAQLHQLRGRIGRGDAQSYCIFVCTDSGENSKKRLEILNSSNDGFVIASEDLKLRGPGDLLGVRQSGDLQFKLADIFTDSAILKKAADDASKILLDDPDLSKPSHKELSDKLTKLRNSDTLYSL